MWTETDTYLENEFNKEERAKKLLEKYEDTDNEDIKFLVKYIKNLKRTNKFLDKRESEYFQKANEYKYIARDFIYYANELERNLKIEYRINHKENAEKFYNSTISKRPNKEID